MVHNALNSLSTSNLISVEWIPGHCGHDGNETADKLANIRTPSYNQSLSEEKDKLPLPQSFFKHKIAEHINRKLNKRWQDCNISKNTKQFISPILNYNLNGQHLFKLNTDILRPLTRLITGHNNLNHFQNKLDGTTSPTCSFCNENIHIRTRQNTFGKSPITIPEVIQTIKNSKSLNLESLLQFVNDKSL